MSEIHTRFHDSHDEILSTTDLDMSLFMRCGSRKECQAKLPELLSGVGDARQNH